MPGVAPDFRIMKSVHFFVLLVGGVLATAQAADTTRVTLSSARAQLSAISAAPGDFPNVHLVVRALDDEARPIWGLGLGDVEVQEGQERADVLSLRALGDSGTVRLGLALDFSGSMIADSAMLAAHPAVDSLLLTGMRPPLPTGVRTPLDEAKLAITEFAELHPTEFALLAFNDQVYQVVAVGEGLEPMREAFESMEPNGGTAMYDAAYAAVEQLAQILAPGDGGAAILLTDGMDNASRRRLEDVVDLAQKEGIPIFTVGLGQVDRARLQQLADQTHGRAYFTHHSSELSAIYGSIQRELASYYTLTYASPLVASASSWPEGATERILSIEIVEPTAPIAPEVQSELDALSLLREYALPAGALLAAVTASGIALAYRRRRQPALRIVRMYPNPASDLLNLEIEGEATEWAILSLSGVPVKSESATAGSHVLDVAPLASGNYLLRVSNAQGDSVTERLQILR